MNLALAGNGATHPMAGAVWAKYFNVQNQETAFLRNSSAFLAGVLSHFVYDSFGNYEPRANTWEMAYFSAEGVLGGALLIPQWKKDKSLFWGSLGGMFPDLEHSISIFQNRKFPTHNGVFPHGERKNFTQGAFENLALNAALYYLLARGSGKVANYQFGLNMGLWDGRHIAKHGLYDALYNTTSPGSAGFTFRIPVDRNKKIEIHTSTWMKRLYLDPNKSIHKKRVVNALNITLNLYSSPKTIKTFAGIGASVFIWGDSHPVNEGDIAFIQYQKFEYRLAATAGLDLRLDSQRTIVFSFNYFPARTKISNSHSSPVSEWSPGIAILNEF
jgi:hypothetical protein